MRDIVIVGAGAFAAEVVGCIIDSNKYDKSEKYNIVGYLDDSKENYERYRFEAPLLGTISDHKKLDDTQYLLGIASIDIRQSVLLKFLEMGCDFGEYIHPSAIIYSTAVIGRGNVICSNTYLGPNMKLGDYNLVNSKVILGHDVVVGENNNFCPGTGISGYTKIGSNNLFGVNSATIPSVEIGDNNKIAAGMVVDKNVGNESVVFYRFKEKVLAVPKVK